VILGLHAKSIHGVREWFTKGEYRVGYRDHRHIPPGGNYFAMTRFMTGENLIDVYMIATAFLDLRSYLPIFRPFSKRYTFITPITGRVKDKKKFRARLYLDIESTLKTAVHEKIDVLILGASG